MSKKKYDLKMKLVSNSWCIQVNDKTVFLSTYETCKRILNDKKQYKYYINLYIENYLN